MSTIKIKWQAEDGYMGGSRPHSFTVDVHEFDEMSPDEIDGLVTELIQDDFEQKVTWTVRGGVDAVVEQIVDALRTTKGEAI